MFGKNPIEKEVKTNGFNLRIVKDSPFFTIQGEGPFSGHAAIFVRLHGCNLRCIFCDTEFSDEANPTVSTVDLARACYNIRMRHPAAKLVVITGGEPLRQNITSLVRHLLKQGFIVQIETAGTLWPADLSQLYDEMDCRNLHIVVSPKTGALHSEVVKHAQYYKYVVGSGTEYKNGVFSADTQGTGKMRPLAMPTGPVQMYVSPCDEYDEVQNKKNLDMVRHLSMTHGFIVSLQTHKILNVL